LLYFIDVKSYWEDPLPTYEMANTHYALPGEFVRLYCEGFVGKYINDWSPSMQHTSLLSSIINYRYKNNLINSEIRLMQVKSVFRMPSTQ